MSESEWITVICATVVALVPIVSRLWKGDWLAAVRLLVRLFSRGSAKLIAGALLCSLAFGCENPAHKRIAQYGEQVFLKVVDKANLDQTTLSARGRLINPSYEVDGFVGFGGYFHGMIKANGVEIEAAVNAAGRGEAQLDQDLRDKLYRIGADQELSREAKEKLYAEVVRKLFGVQVTTRPAQ